MNVQAPAADDATVRQVFARYAAGDSYRAIGAAVGLGTTAVGNILFGRSRRSIAPDQPRLGEPGAPPRGERRQVPKPVRKSCLECVHWNTGRAGVYVYVNGLRQRLNPCGMEFPEAAGTSAWRAGFRCSANTASMEVE